MSYIPYNEESVVGEGLNSAVLTAEAKGVELFTIAALSYLNHISTSNLTQADMGLAQKGAHLHGQIDYYELLGQNLELEKANYIGTNKEGYYHNLIQNNTSKLNVLKNNFADLNESVDYASAKASFSLQFVGVIGSIASGAGLAYTVYNHIATLDGRIDSAIENNIPPEQVFADLFLKSTEIIVTTVGAIAAELIMGSGAPTLTGFLASALKATAVSFALTVSYKVGSAIGGWVYNNDSVASTIQDSIDDFISIFDENTMDRYPEAISTISILAKTIDPNISLSEINEILSRSKNTFKDYGEITSMLNSINKVFGIEITTEITGSDQLIDKVVNSIIAIKDAHPNQNFIFLSVSSEDVENNVTSSTESIALAYRYALENNNPFVIISNGVIDTLYSAHNENSELELTNFSDSYIQDKLSFYKLLDHDRLTDGTSSLDTSPSPHNDAKYIDMKLGLEYSTSDGLNNGPALRVIFGTDGDDVITNVITGTGDFLYGRGGNDTISGYNGDDYIEGGRGVDILKGGSGTDTYHFNSGDSNIHTGLFDRIIDSDADNKLSFGSTVNTNSFKYYNIGYTDLGVYFESAEGAKDLIILDNWYSNQNMIVGLDVGENLSKVLTPKIYHLDYGWGQWSGTAGGDTISYILTLFDDSDNPTTNYVIAGFGGDDNLAGFNVSGGSGNDTINFYNPYNPQSLGGKLYGGTGNDTIYGGDYNDMIVTFADGPHASIWTILEMIALDVNFDIDDLNLEGMPAFDPASYSPDYSDPDSADMRQWYERILHLKPGEGETNHVSSGDGFDTVYGGFGNEVYHLYAGEGAEGIIDMGGENIVTFDYNLADVSVMLQGGTFFFYQGDAFPSTFGSFLNPYSHAGYINAVSVNALGGHETFTYQFTDETITHSNLLNMAYNFKASDGDDIISFEGGYSNDIAKKIDLGAGNDTLSFDGSHANIIGGTGDDTFELWSSAGAEHTVTLRVGDGNDTLQHYFGDLNLDIDFVTNPAGIDVNKEDITVERHTNNEGIQEWTVRYSDNDSLTIRGANGLNNVNFLLPAGLIFAFADLNEKVFAAESGDHISTSSVTGSTIVSGQGQDHMEDHMSNDTRYELALGSGQDTLHDMGGQDAIIFGQNIEQSDLVFVREGANLTIEYSENDRVTINDWYTFGDYRVENIQFADGTALNSGDLSLLTDSLSVGDLELVGSQYEDYLVGDTGNDTLTGGEGNDYLSGGEGNDEYRFNLGDGMDTVSDYAGADTFVFGPGILPSDIVFQRIGDNLQVNYSLNDSITIEYWFFGAEYRVESFEFDDGTVWDQAYLSGQTDTLITPGMTVDGTEYDDYLYGSSGDDVLTGGTGNDTLFGGQGNDEYRFGLGDGLDIVSEEGGVDTLVFGPGISASDIVLTRMGDNLEIAYSPNDAILIDYWYASPDLKIEAFMFDDGTVWDQTTITNLTANLAEPDLTVTGSEFDDHLTTGGGNDDVSGLGGHDIIETYAGNDTLNGGTGDDYLIGGQGDDSYFFTIGDGVDFIHDEGGADQIVFGPSITQSDVSFERFGDNLTVHYNASDSFTVSGWYATPEFEIEAFHFNDGSSWNASALEGLTENLPVQALPGVELTGTEFGDFLTGSEGNDILVGLAGDDFLESYSGDDVLTGGTGMDYLIGGAGNDTYLFNVGDGVDFIGDEDGQDAIHFGESISLADLLIETDGNDLFIHYTENDSITVDSHAGIGKVETIHFYDGSFIDSAAIDAMTIQQQVPDAA